MNRTVHPGVSRAAQVWHRGVRNGLPMYAGGLAFLGFALVPAWTRPVSLGVRLGVTGVCLLIAIAYLAIPLVVELSLRARWLGVLAVTAAVALLVPFLGVAAIYFSAFVCIALASLTPWRHSRLVIPVTTLTLVGVGLLADDWLAISLAMVGGSVGIWIAFAIRQEDLRQRLIAAEERNAVLAVAAERERIGRDLHDILGHSLTAVAVKAQLARRLADRDPAAAATEMAEVERLARQALAEVRATASGMQQVRLASETASARSVLQAAGVECRVSTAAAQPDERASELLGFVVREAVTNVIRHSGADRC
ncbi:sensor histidine kinase [Naumannella sp. ID2617S]|nr:sensor histidine kinase [Naumannella sp. ID2617S]